MEAISERRVLDVPENYTDGIHPEISDGGRTAELVRRISDKAWVKEGEEMGRNALTYTELEDRTFEEIRGVAEELRVSAEAREMKIEIEEDFYGNLFVTLEGEDKEAKKILIESHGDSVPRGGRIDGVYGVATGLSLIEKYISGGAKPKKPLMVGAFRGEESSRTSFGLLGSALATGSVTVEKVKSIKNQSFPTKESEDGFLHIFDNLRQRYSDRIGRRVGYMEFAEILDNELKKSTDFLNTIGNVIEVHSEQADTLQTADRPIAVVSTIGAAERFKLHFGDEIFDRFSTETLTTGESFPSRLRLRIKGQADHSGAAPMTGEGIAGKTYERRDALVAAASVLKSFLKGSNVRVMDISVPGGSMNTVPGVCDIDLSVPQKHLQRVVDIFKRKLGNKFEIEVFDEKEAMVGGVDHIKWEVLNAVLRVISGVEETAREAAVRSGGKVRATVGGLEISRGVVTLQVDQRKACEKEQKAVRERISAIVKSVTDGMEEYGVKVVREETSNSEISDCSAVMIGVAKKVYATLYGEEMPERISMPGHDLARFILKGVPGVMFYGRSYNGSHNPYEAMRAADVLDMDEFLAAFVDELMNAA